MFNQEDIHPVEEQHVIVDIQIERTANALDQRDSASLGGSRTGNARDPGRSIPIGVAVAREIPRPPVTRRSRQLLLHCSTSCIHALVGHAP